MSLFRASPSGPEDLRARADAAGGHLPALILAADRLAAQVVPGAHGLRRAGPGEEFWQYRPAGSGDGIRAIDWRRSGRSDQQFVRDREAQTAQAAAIWISAGQGMGFAGGPDRPSKSDQGRLLGLALAMLMLRGGERVGMLGGAARSGRIQVEKLAEELHARPLLAGDDTPQAEAIRPNSRVILIGDFLESVDWVQPFLSRAAGMGVRGVMLQLLDPDEEVFPYQGAVLFTSPSGGMRHGSRDAEGLRAQYLARLAARRDGLRAACQAAGWQFGHGTTGADPAVHLAWLWRILGG